MSDTPTDIHVTLSPPLAQAFANDRQLGHSHVMSSLPHGLGDTPRNAAGVLWRIDQHEGALIVRYSNVPAGVMNLGVITAQVGVLATGRLQVHLSINCQKTPPARLPQHIHDAIKARPKGKGRAYRSKMVVVPEADRLAWINQRLIKVGFTPELESIELSKVYTANLGPRRGGGIPAVDVSATGTVSDEALFTNALAAGVGKGKNFGLGLIITTTTAINSNDEESL